MERTLGGGWETRAFSALPPTLRDGAGSPSQTAFPHREKELPSCIVTPARPCSRPAHSKGLMSLLCCPAPFYCACPSPAGLFSGG